MYQTGTPKSCTIVLASDGITPYPTSSYTFNAGTLTFSSYAAYWNGHMADQIKISCSFGSDVVLSPILDLYTSNNDLFTQIF